MKRSNSRGGDRDDGITIPDEVKTQGIIDEICGRGVWTCKDGRAIKIVDLGDEHLRNILRMLRRQAVELKQKMEKEFLGLPAPNGDAAQMAHDSELNELLDSDWRDYAHAQYPELEEEAERRKLHWEEPDEEVVLHGPNRGSLERKVVGALRSSISAHGPITNETAPSAAKRVVSVIKQHNKEAKREGTNAGDSKRPGPMVVPRFRKNPDHRHEKGS